MWIILYYIVLYCIIRIKLLLSGHFCVSVTLSRNELSTQPCRGNREDTRTNTRPIFSVPRTCKKIWSDFFPARKRKLFERAHVNFFKFLLLLKLNTPLFLSFLSPRHLSYVWAYVSLPPLPLHRPPFAFWDCPFWTRDAGTCVTRRENHVGPNFLAGEILYFWNFCDYNDLPWIYSTLL